MTVTAKIGAVGFGLWALLHIVGAGAILAAVMSGGPEAGYVIYGVGEGALPAATGAILGYFAFLLLAIALVVGGIAARMNWNNSEAGLAINTGIVLVIEIGLILFLLIPGHLPFMQALPGFVFFAIGVIAGGMACRKDPENA
ncbi:hypothetical protein [uncultured Tateyamaria sp.]|uniref:hypothetical protein n=1 Tax=uncultured Tateyamaria sp. TaxID=455651 RepID=UPI002627F2EA|nr:hypothetical protein [uncultured Tateyamaria sp.]